MNGGEAVSTLTGNFRKDGRFRDGEKPHPDVLIHYRLAKVFGGLRDRSVKGILTPEFDRAALTCF